MTKEPPRNWSLAEKISFRFFFPLFILFILFFSNGTFPVPGIRNIILPEYVITWLANGVLERNYIHSIGGGGSGDTIPAYMTLLFVCLMAATTCIIWCILGSARCNYNRLLYWLTVAVRFYVGIMLIHYGLAKVIKVQFASPDLMRSLKTYGDSSPMGLAWTFFGFSDGYNYFTGVAELLCGLLLFRKTVVLGAMISLAVTVNIMAVNYFFDVPVKILSTALVVMSIFLLLPNFHQLIDLFFKGKSTALKELQPPHIRNKYLRYGRIAAKYGFIILAILPIILNNLNARKLYGDAVPKLPLYGVYTVESFEPETPLPKWKKLVIQRSSYSAVELENDAIEYCNMSIDTTKHQLNIVFKDDLTTSHKFSYKVSDSEYLEFTGVYFDRTLKVKLKKYHFELTERPFHWISEVPYNR